MSHKDLSNLIQQHLQPSSSSSCKPRIKLPPLPEDIVSAGFVQPTLFGVAHTILTTNEQNNASLYLGPKSTAYPGAYEALKKANIVGIVNCAPCTPNFHRDNNIAYCNVPVNDIEGANISTFFDGAITFLQHMLQKGSVLVHCQMGISRSATIVIAYLMKVHQMSLTDAYFECKRKRPMIRPNDGFWNQLLQYEQHLQEIKHHRNTETPTTHCLDSSAWMIQSNAIFCTCQAIPDVLMKHETWESMKERIKNQGIVEFFSSCLDFVWGRGILGVDIQWLVCVCQYAQSHYCEVVVISSKKIISDILDNPNSTFSESWCGEIYPRDVQKIKNALKNV